MEKVSRPDGETNAQAVYSSLLSDQILVFLKEHDISEEELWNLLAKKLIVSALSEKNTRSLTDALKVLDKMVGRSSSSADGDTTTTVNFRELRDMVNKDREEKIG